MSKLFVSLKLYLFSLLFTYSLFRPQKHKLNRRFHVRDICFSAVADCEKKYEIQTGQCKTQTADCRLGVKCRLRVIRIKIYVKSVRTRKMFQLIKLSFVLLSFVCFGISSIKMVILRLFENAQML